MPKIDTFVGVMYVCFKPMINWDKLKEEAWFEDGAVRFDFDCDVSSENIYTVKSVCLIIIYIYLFVSCDRVMALLYVRISLLREVRKVVCMFTMEEKEVDKL